MSRRAQSAPRAPGRCKDSLHIEGIVRSIEPDGAVELELAAASSCAGCAGACAWRRPTAPGRARFRTALRLEPGDVVRVALPARHVLATAALLHGLPLAALLLGALSGWTLGHSDAATIAGAAAGMTAMLVATRSLRRRAECQTIDRARLERVICPGR